MVKNCDLGLENVALGPRPRAVFSRPRSQFSTIRTSQPANNIYVFHHSKDSSLFIKNLRKMCLLSRPEEPYSTDWENSIFFFEAVSVAQ